jgi:putative phosphoribosyl transferase
MSVEYEPVRIALRDALLNGDLAKVEGSSGIVLFAHGSGSGRHSPRNRYVAERMIDNGLSVLLMDLLTEAEDRVDQLTREHRFNIPMLADRVREVKNWVQRRRGTIGLKVGLYGSSTGAAAALIAAAESPEGVGAVVSRGGRVDLASDALPRVKAPTLFIVGGLDTTVLVLNRRAFELLSVEKRLDVIPGAGHLFSEPGALDEVTRLSVDWFKEHL